MSSLDTQIWALRFDWSKSPASARLVALAVARRSFRTGACYASQSDLAEATDLSGKTVKRTLDELAEHGWLERVAAYRRNGARSTDKVWLTLPAVTLSATEVSEESIRETNEAMDMVGVGPDTVSTATAPTGGAGAYEGGEQDPPTVSPAFLRPTSRPTHRPDSRAQTHAGDGELEIAVDLIWSKASQQGRQRSSKADIKKGLAAACARGHQMETILKGLAGYYESPDATKDDGAFQRGAHVILASDRFVSFLPERPSEPTTAAERTARAMVGDADTPTDDMQRLWMDLFTKGMPWNPERGPEPGRLGCKITAEIQRAFGVEPFALPAADDDNSGAFD